MIRSSQVGAIIACVMAMVMALGCTAPTPAQRPGVAPQPTPPGIPGQQAAIPVSPAFLPGWAGDDLDGLSAAISRQCAMRTPPGSWPKLCIEFNALPPAKAGANGSRPTPLALRRWLETRFAAWPLRDASGGAEGLLTGYYEPQLTGSRKRESSQQTPLYSRPVDLLTIDLAEVDPRLAGMRLRGRLQGQRVVPFYSRADIETKGPLTGNELLWVDDRVGAFFLEIQGSGRVTLRDGATVRVVYADQNGHPYRAIGRTLIDRGALRSDEVSAPSIRSWLQANPAQAAEVMRTNPSVVFFREAPPPPTPAPGDPEAGPAGSLGVPLTALRSLAVDRSKVALGSLVWLDTTHPVDGKPMRRAMAAQDTGGAITGAIRGDVFWGYGAEAERAAGLMRSRGRMWVLWPAGEALPASGDSAR
jgi:membrane-bound lytic murein transglycosylase A